MISQAEENYLKAIFKLSEKKEGTVSTNAIAAEMNTAAASVTDMVKRLAKNGFIQYEPYRGVRLTKKGDQVSRNLIRKHRIWETFLFSRLNFSWDEVHDLAEQLEHIRSDELVNRLEALLDFPRFDPHGEPIPDKKGRFATREQIALSEMEAGQSGVIVGVREHSKAFLQFLEKQNLVLGSKIELIEKYDFDNSLKIIINQESTTTVTQKVGFNLFIKQN